MTCWIVGNWTVGEQQQIRVTNTVTSKRFGRQSIYDCSTPLFRWYSMWKNKNIYCIKPIVYRSYSPRMWPHQFFLRTAGVEGVGGHFFTQMNTIPSRTKRPKTETSDGTECKRGRGVEWECVKRIYCFMQTQLRCPSLIHESVRRFWALSKWIKRNNGWKEIHFIF